MIIASNIYCFSKYIVEEPNYPYCLFDNAFLVRYNRGIQLTFIVLFVVTVYQYLRRREERSISGNFPRPKKVKRS